MSMTLTIDEAVGQIDISRELLYRKLRKGEVPAKKENGRWEIIAKELEIVMTNNPETNRDKKEIRITKKPEKRKKIKCNEAPSCIWSNYIGSEKRYHCPFRGCLRGKN